MNLYCGVKQNGSEFEGKYGNRSDKMRQTSPERRRFQHPDQHMTHTTLLPPFCICVYYLFFLLCFSVVSHLQVFNLIFRFMSFILLFRQLHKLLPLTALIHTKKTFPAFYFHTLYTAVLKKTTRVVKGSARMISAFCFPPL